MIKYILVLLFMITVSSGLCAMDAGWDMTTTTTSSGSVGGQGQSK
jgi:hypothetical protein